LDIRSTGTGRENVTSANRQHTDNNRTLLQEVEKSIINYYSTHENIQPLPRMIQSRSQSQSQRRYQLCYLLLVAAFSSVVQSFVLTLPRQHQQQQQQQSSRSSPGGTIFSKHQDDQDEETYTVDRSSQLLEDASSSSSTTSTNGTISSSSSSTEANYIDDLTPPPINFARNSILFDENPSTKRNNNAALDAWVACQTNLPAVVTGVWPWRDASITRNNPVGAFYNMAFVRIPVIVVGILYVKNLYQGHPLIMDIGDGPFEMSPLVVVAVLAFILA
jgi:hypothetical protein